MPRDNKDKLLITTNGMDRRAFIRTAGGGVLGVALLGGLAACGDDDISIPGTPTSVDFQIRWLKEVSFGGWYAGIENGYFADEGIDLNIIAGGPTLDVQQVVSGGGVPIGEGITDRIIRGRAEQNIPFVVFGALYQKVPTVLMSLAEKNLTEPADIIGKRIATTAEGRPLIEALLTNLGLSATDWEFVASSFDPSPIVQDEADLYHGFRTGQGVSLEMQGFAMNYITYDQFNYQMYDAPIFALESELEDNEDLLVRFMRGTIKGWEWATSNPDEIAKLTVDKYGHDQLTIEQQTAESRAQVSDIVTPESQDKGLFWMEEDRWQDTIDFLFDSGSLATSIKASDIMTQRILKRALDGNSQLLG